MIRALGLAGLVLLASCETRTPATASAEHDSPAAMERRGKLDRPPPTVGQRPATPWQAGDNVFVEWNGDWWNGRIVAVKPADTYLIHYDGWAASWDETVPAARLAPMTAER